MSPLPPAPATAGAPPGVDVAPAPLSPASAGSLPPALFAPVPELAPALAPDAVLPPVPPIGSPGFPAVNSLPQPLAVPQPEALVDTLFCFDIAVAWVAVPLLCAAIALRGAFAAGALWRSALVGGGIGLFAGAAINLHCDNVAPEHMLLGHGLSVVLAAALGAFALVLRARA